MKKVECRNNAVALDYSEKVDMLVAVSLVESNLDMVKALVVVDTMECLKDSETDSDVGDDVP